MWSQMIRPHRMSLIVKLMFIDAPGYERNINAVTTSNNIVSFLKHSTCFFSFVFFFLKYNNSVKVVRFVDLHKTLWTRLFFQSHKLTLKSLSTYNNISTGTTWFHNIITKEEKKNYEYYSYKIVDLLNLVIKTVAIIDVFSAEKHLSFYALEIKVPLVRGSVFCWIAFLKSIILRID